MKFILSVFLTVCFSLCIRANNISVSNVTLAGQNTAAGLNNANNFSLVQFNLSWENSHRVSFGPTNWDAAWIFIKYKVAGTTAWQHARLNNIGHTAPIGSTIDAGLQTPGTAFNATTNPGIGAFIYRSTSGTGTFTANSTQLRWNYGANGLLDNSVVEIQVYAVEMIYVPTAAFNAGGGGGTSAFTSTTINTANPTTVASGIGALGGMGGGYPTGQVALTSSTFPNGFSAFYTMKYEISQQQYVDFLNNLPSSQSASRFPASTGSRHGIVLNAGFYSTALPFVACNFLSWADFAAYLDWSGLRPMTELEFEKAARGTIAPVVGEFAWGTSIIFSATGLVNSSSTNETAANIGANCNASALISGPVRVGMFAGINTTRVAAGATYYGAMEFSGNLWERIITLSTLNGRSYSGLHGDGLLSATGEANISLWPDAAALGCGIRGGSWADNGGEANFISSRSQSALAYPVRYSNIGGRGVRSAL